MAHGLNSLIKHETECNDDVRTGSASTSIIKPNYNINAVVKLEHNIRAVSTICTNQQQHQGTAGANSGGPVVQMTVTPPTKMGSRRIFSPQFKLQVLDSYRNDPDCKGNQRATARKYGIHRRQIQKWLQCEGNLRSTVLNGGNTGKNNHNINQSKSVTVSTSSVHVHANTHAAGFVSPIHNTYVYEPTVSYPTHYEISAIYPTTSSSETYLSVNYDPSYYQPPQPANIVTEHYETRSFIDLSSTSAPIDLSLHRKRLHGEPIDNECRIFNKKAHKCGDWTNNSKIITDLTDSYPKALEAVDLTCRKRESSTSSSPQHQEIELPRTPAKPVKLFKPYLLDEEADKDEEKEPSNNESRTIDTMVAGNGEKKLDKKCERNDPIIWSNHPTPSTSSISSSCSPVYESSNNFFPNDYNLYSNSLYQISPSSYEIASYWYPPQSSPPVSGYDSTASVSSNLSDTSEHPYDSYAYQSIKYHQYTHHKDIHKWLQEDHLRNRMIITN